MPVIEIAALLPADGLDVPTALGAVTTEVSTFLEEDPRGTWAVFHEIEPGHCAEGTDAPPAQPAETHPAIMRVFANRPAEQAVGLLEAVGTAVVKAFGLREGNVFVRFELADADGMYRG